MQYKVQRGDTIAHVSKVMGSNWQTLKNLNPQAIGRSSINGNWFVKEGAVLTDTPKSQFGTILKAAEQRKATGSPGVVADQRQQTASAKERSHTLKAGETVWDLAMNKYHVDPKEILKLNNISDPRSLQIGQILRIPEKLQSTGKEQVVASWYGQYHHGLPMANGKPYDMFAPTIAHKEIPLGTRVLLENPETGQKAVATVTDRGPYIAGRDVDLSYKLAQRLSLEKQGVGNLTLRVL